MSRRTLLALALFAGLVAAGWLSGVGTLAADDPKQPRLRGQLYPKWRELGLSDEQKQRVYKVQAEYRDKIEALEEQIKKLKREERTKAELVLTPAQKARLRELLGGEPSEPPVKDKAPPKDK